MTLIIILTSIKLCHRVHKEVHLEIKVTSHEKVSSFLLHNLSFSNLRARLHQLDMSFPIISCQHRKTYQHRKSSTTGGWRVGTRAWAGCGWSLTRDVQEVKLRHHGDAHPAPGQSLERGEDSEPQHLKQSREKGKKSF